MVKFCVAYKNEYTTKIDEQRGSACNGWVRMSAFVSFDEAQRIFQTATKQFSENTAVGLFREGYGVEAWYNKRPRYLHNRHVLFSESAVRQAFGGLINAARSDVL